MTRVSARLPGMPASAPRTRSVSSIRPTPARNSSRITSRLYSTFRRRSAGVRPTPPETSRALAVVEQQDDHVGPDAPGRLGGGDLWQVALVELERLAAEDLGDALDRLGEPVEVGQRCRGVGAGDLALGVLGSPGRGEAQEAAGATAPALLAVRHLVSGRRFAVARGGRVPPGGRAGVPGRPGRGLGRLLGRQPHLGSVGRDAQWAAPWSWLRLRALWRGRVGWRRSGLGRAFGRRRCGLGSRLGSRRLGPRLVALPHLGACRGGDRGHGGGVGVCPGLRGLGPVEQLIVLARDGGDGIARVVRDGLSGRGRGRRGGRGAGGCGHLTAGRRRGGGRARLAGGGGLGLTPPGR